MDPAHQFNGVAHARLVQVASAKGMGNLSNTENGCLRIMSNPGYPFPGLTVDRVRGILTELTRVEGHLFRPDSATLPGWKSQIESRYEESRRLPVTGLRRIRANIRTGQNRPE